MKRNARIFMAAALALLAACDPPAGEEPEAAKPTTPAAPLPPPQPIPKTGRLGNSPEEQAARLAWGRKMFLESYERVGLRNPRWDGDARRLIADSLPAVFVVGDTGNAAARMKLGRSLYARGCRDPLILDLAGRAIFDSIYDAAEPESFYAAAVEGMKTVPYPRAVARHVATDLYDRYAWRAAGRDVREPLRQLELHWFEQSMREGSYGPDDDMVLAWQLQKREGAAFFFRSSFRATAALGSAPWLEPWIKHLFLGLRHHDEAWRARGGDFASAVKRGDWPRFNAFNRQARTDLVESWRLAPDRAEAASTMIQVAVDLPEPGENSRLWFDRSVAAQLDYVPAYERQMRLLKPRWSGGSYEERLRFAREVADTGRYDTDVPLQAVRAVTGAYRDQKDSEAGGGGDPIYARPGIYSMVEGVLQGYLKDPSQTARRERFEGWWALAADQAGRPAEALSHLDAAGGHLPNELWTSLEQESPNQFAARVSLLAGPGGGAAARAAKLRAEGDAAGALAAYREALALDSSPRSAAAGRDAVATLEAEQRLSGADWSSVLPADDTLPGWLNYWGDWKTDARHAAIVGTSSARGLYLVSQARVPGDFEVRGRFERVERDGPLEAEVVFGPPDRSFGSWASVRVSCPAQGACTASVPKGRGASQGSVSPLPNRTPSSLLVRVVAGELTATIDGQPVVSSLKLADGWRSQTEPLHIGIAAVSIGAPLATRFLDLEVRRVTAP